MAHDVVLISNDASLASMVHTVIPAPGRLRILRSSMELPAEPELGAETVVLDLPADIRLAALAEVRKRYSGRLLVALSSEAEAEGWPDDPACRFLIRPFQVDQVGEALRAPLPAVGAVARPTRREPAGISAATALRASSPRPGAPGAGATGTRDTPATRGGPEAPAGSAGPANLADSVEDAAGGSQRAPDEVAVPEPEPPRGRRRALLTVLLVVVLAAAATFGGVAIGHASVDLENRPPSGGSTNGSGAPPPGPPSTAAHASHAAACADAMDQADAAISYLVQGINDQRLSKAMQQYRADRGACLGRAGG